MKIEIFGHKSIFLKSDIRYQKSEILSLQKALQFGTKSFFESPLCNFVKSVVALCGIIKHQHPFSMETQGIRELKN